MSNLLINLAKQAAQKIAKRYSQNREQLIKEYASELANGVIISYLDGVKISAEELADISEIISLEFKEEIERRYEHHSEEAANCSHSLNKILNL